MQNTTNSSPWGTYPNTPEAGIEYMCGLGGFDTWKFTHTDGTKYVLTVSNPSGWTFTASDDDLKWTPVPTVEVRTMSPGDFSWSDSRDRLPIEGATKRHVPAEGAHKAVIEFRKGLKA